MRVEPELTYQDYKDGVIGAFNLLGDKVFDDDLTEEEYKQMQEDVDYILSKVEMYDVVDSDDDEE